MLHISVCKVTILDKLFTSQQKSQVDQIIYCGDSIILSLDLNLIIITKIIFSLNAQSTTI